MPAHTLIGRSPTCFLLLDDEHASKEHAVVQWADGRWSIKDLGSRNGTFVDGDRIESGVLHRLEVGSRLAFGRAEDPWVFEDDRPPEAVALNLENRAVRESRDGLLALPTDSEPDVVVLQSAAGDWFIERSDGEDSDPARDRQTLSVGSASWCLLLPEPQEATPLLQAAIGIESVTFRFSVSQDEERVNLTLVGPFQKLMLQAREFNYILLVLARARLAEQTQPLPERGWLDRVTLLRMLRMRPTALNVSIHRARQQLSAMGLVGAAGIVEVRRGSRRFGSDRIEIGPLVED